MSVVNSIGSPISTDAAVRLGRSLYGVTGAVTELPGYRGQNFHIAPLEGESFVLKVTGPWEPVVELEAQTEAMRRVRAGGIDGPEPCQTLDGAYIAQIEHPDGDGYHARLVTYVPGAVLANFIPHTPDLLQNIGSYFGRMDAVLRDFSHPGARRDLRWDLRRAVSVCREYARYISPPERRQLVEEVTERFASEIEPYLSTLPTSVIHNDGNDHNILIRRTDAGGSATSGVVSGVIDYGDLVETSTICELAIVCAYGMLDKEDPVAAATHITRGYHRVSPLTEEEVIVLAPLIRIRWCVSVALSAFQRHEHPTNDYLAISERPVWRVLEWSESGSWPADEVPFREACGISSVAHARDKTELLEVRRSLLGSNLSLSYDEPLHIVRGDGCYLYDPGGRRYLDMVNNVCHVGHCHPEVVSAAHEQMLKLNTNTRYLHENIVRYAERLCSTLPEPLRVCFFVCSGSEANDLALRLAQTHTGQRDLLVLEGAYHGNLSSLIDISPYKFYGPGGKGAPSHVRVLTMPDVYRGALRDDPWAGKKYASEIRGVVEDLKLHGRAPAAFFAESLQGCGGQIVLPPGYFEAAYGIVRNAGGVCVADEVQVGFGRVGTHWWGFETQNVVPDIVTLGKPIGNGHPLGAVVTTKAIASSFANGMEYFNTFGGNPVSCAVGLAVLDVIESEGLRENARVVGEYLKTGLIALKERWPLIGDVRGIGLFLGVELVADRESLVPAREEARLIIEHLKNQGILLSIDGPLLNVLKIKPPMVFAREDADFFLFSLDRALREVST